MVRFETDFSLQKYQTFGIPVKADYFFEFTETTDLEEFVRANESWKTMPRLILGGGSNLLFTDDFHGLVFFVNIPGIKLVRETSDHVWLEAGAGELWDNFVGYSVEKNYGGIENLSLIPGHVGAVPVQNIGAYGVEAGEYIDEVNGFDLETLEFYAIPGKDCRFGYRDSLFKHELKDRFIVTSVTFKLLRHPEYKLNYGTLAREVEQRGAVSLQTVRDAVIAIRRSKLPDPAEIGNAGSFFKNPVVSSEQAGQLKQTFPEMPVYPAGQNQQKLAAGWLIDQCGWKGFRRGDAGVHQNQALVLVNYGKSSGKEIVELAREIQNDVKAKFGIQLTPEVNIIG